MNYRVIERDSGMGIPGLGTVGLGAAGPEIAEQLRALHEQRRLVEALLDDVSRTRSRLDIEPGAGAAWQSPAQRTYMARRLDLRNQFERIIWLLEGARESVNGIIARVAHG